MFGDGEEEVEATMAAAMLGGGCVGNDVARGNGTMSDDDDNDGDGATGDDATGYDDDNNGDG
jgi:hypothetical protein